MLKERGKLMTSPTPIKYTKSTDPLYVKQTFFQKQKNKKKISTTYSRKILTDEIKRTNSLLKMRRFRKPSNEGKMMKAKRDHKSILQNLTCSNQQGESKSFSQFLMRKKTENTYIRSKMKIFGNVITERSKAKIEGNINDIISKQIDNYEQEKTSNSMMLSRIKKYIISHKILQNLLQLMVSNPQHISLKKQSPLAYEKLKKQMIEVIINEKNMLDIYKIIEGELEQSRKTKFDFTIQKMNEIKKNRKPFFLIKKKKKDQLTDQIHKTLDRLKIMIMHAVHNFQPVKYKHKTEISLQWDQPRRMTEDIFLINQ